MNSTEVVVYTYPVAVQILLWILGVVTAFYAVREAVHMIWPTKRQPRDEPDMVSGSRPRRNCWLGIRVRRWQKCPHCPTRWPHGFLPWVW